MIGRKMGGKEKGIKKGEGKSRRNGQEKIICIGLRGMVGGSVNQHHVITTQTLGFIYINVSIVLTNWSK